MEFWKRIRLLITDGCNYRCPFCHNEGQAKSSVHREMSMAIFRRVIDAIGDKNLADVCVSGGEPFLNKFAVDMLLYACEKTEADISCASNLALITDEHIERLSRSRVKFNVQFPYADAALFRMSTSFGNFNKVCARIDSMVNAGIKVGLNTVVQANTIEHIEGVLSFAAERNIPLKLLPELGRTESINCRTELEKLWHSRILKRTEKGTGAIKWTVDKGGVPVSVLFIDSPCLSGAFSQCRQYGEIRVWPTGELQPCIFKKAIGLVEECDSADQITEKLASLWRDFKSC